MTLLLLKALEDVIVDGVHGADSKPEFGLMQAGFGLHASLAYSCMATKITDKKLEEAINEVLDRIAANTQALIDNDPDLPAKNRINHLARRANIGKGTLRRILGGSGGTKTEAKSAAQIDTLMRLAWHYKIPCVQLLEPHDPKSIVLDMRGQDQRSGRREFKSA